jgi:hypothetical protein
VIERELVRVRPLRAIFDASVLIKASSGAVLVQSAKNGYLLPFWSPAIINDATLYLTWRWMQTTRPSFATAEGTRIAWEELEASLKTWFAPLSGVFRVAEDGPVSTDPSVILFAEKRDFPIWIAALHARADFVVSEEMNLAPSDATGVRQHEGVLFVTFDEFSRILDWYAELDLPQPESSTATDPVPVSSLPAEVRQMIVELLAGPKGPARTVKGHIYHI